MISACVGESESVCPLWLKIPSGRCFGRAAFSAAVLVLLFVCREKIGVGGERMGVRRVEFLWL